MANRKLLSAIYPNLNGTPDDTRLNPHVSALDCRTIVAVSGDTAILSHICQLAIKTTAEYVRTNKLDFATSDKLTEFLRERSPFTPVTTESNAHDDAGRNTRGDKQVAHVKDGSAESRKSVTPERGKGKGEVRGKK